MKQKTMINDKVITIRIPGEVVKTIKDTTDSVSKFIRDAIDTSLKTAKNVKDSVTVTDMPRQETNTNNPEQTVTVEESPAPTSTIYAYQNAKVASDQKCENCGKEIPANSDAVIGLSTDGKPHFFCNDCKK